MKKLLIFMILALVSCRNDSSEEQNLTFETADLVGVWKIVNLKVEGLQINTSCDLGDFIFNKDSKAT